ncbi:MAG: MFS transporter [Chloroflexota bacterium]
MKRIVTAEIVVVIIIMGLSVLSRSILDPIIPLYLTSIGIAPTALGLMLAVAMVGMVFGETTGGWIADRMGISIPLGVGTFGCAPIVLSFILTSNTLLIFLIFFLWGVIRSAIFGPGRGYIGGNVPLTQKATFMAIFSTSMAASRSLGSFTSGFIVDRLGYDWNFYFSAFATFLGGVAVVIGLKKLRQKKVLPIEIQPPPTPRDVPEITASNHVYNHSFILQCTIAALRFFEMGVTHAFLPLFATQVVGVDAIKVGILFTVSGLVTAVLLIPMGRLADWRGKKVFIIVGLLLSAIAMAGIALARSFPWLLGAVVLQGLSMAIFSPAAVALLSDTVPRHRQGTAMGIYGSAEDVGNIVGSALGGFVWVAGGPQLTFLTGTIASGLGALICFTFIKEKVIRSQPPSTGLTNS